MPPATVAVPATRKVRVSPKGAASATKPTVKAAPKRAAASLWASGGRAFKHADVAKLVAAGADVEERGGVLDAPLLVEATLLEDVKLVEALLKAVRWWPSRRARPPALRRNPPSLTPAGRESQRRGAQRNG
jgi:hypothetical protein